MNIYTPVQPYESGGRNKAHLQGAGAHITLATNHEAGDDRKPALAPAPRNIHSTSGWLWQEKSALRTLGQHFSGPRLLAARSIYLALTEIASNQFTPARVHTSCAYLGSVAGCSASSVRRYLREFVSLSLIAVEMGIHQANTYVLLGEAKPPDALEASEMPLADSSGRSRAASSVQNGQRAQIPQDLLVPTRSGISPTVRGEGSNGAGVGGAAARTTGAVAAIQGEGRVVNGGTPGGAAASSTAGRRGRTKPAAGDTLTPGEGAKGSRGKSVRMVTIDHPVSPAARQEATARAVTDGSQIERIKESKTKNQQTDSVVVGSGADSFPVGETTGADSAGILIPVNQEKLLTDEQQTAAQALTGIGVRKSVAVKMAATHAPENVRTWVLYALRQGNLKSRAGFVLAMLDGGEAPPVPISSGYVQHRQQTDPAANSQPEPPCGLTETLVEQGTEATAPPPSARDAAIWQAAQERLRGRVSDAAWGMWLQHVRLVTASGDLAQLASPAVGVAETFERRYASDVCEVLGDLLGRAVEVKFVRGQRLNSLADWRSSADGFSSFDANTCTAHGLDTPCYLPNLPISRAQLTKLVVNACGYILITPQGGQQDFSDVPPSNVFYVSIETAYHNGIISGYPGGIFLPNQSIRRDEMAQIVYKRVTMWLVRSIATAEPGREDRSLLPAEVACTTISR